MAYVKIWIHAVWSTKNRFPWLIGDKLLRMCDHIRENAAKKGIYIDTINGFDEHIHVLMILNAGNSIAKQMQLIKGESAFWANEIRLVEETFVWAAKYFASSVSGKKVPVVRRYIENQQQHHLQQSFKDEFAHFMRSAGYNPDHNAQD